MVARAAPHPAQNLAPSRFWWPHEVHWTMLAGAPDSMAASYAQAREGPRPARIGHATCRAGPFRIEQGRQPDEQEDRVAVVKIIELVGSSKTSSDDAATQALKQAQSSLRNIRAVDIVSTGIRGENLDEYRAHVRVAFLIEGTDVD